MRMLSPAFLSPDTYSALRHSPKLQDDIMARTASSPAPERIRGTVPKLAEQPTAVPPPWIRSSRRSTQSPRLWRSVRRRYPGACRPGNLTGDFDALELDGMSSEWTPSSVGGGVADCADPFATNDALVYQVAVAELPGVPLIRTISSKSRA
jgi:hypothetical protein